MTLLDDIAQMLRRMTSGEKAELLQRLVRDPGDSLPGIDSTPGVAGGDPCIVRTRIPVWVLVHARNLGLTEAEILRSYSTLRAGDLANAWTYYRAHPEDIDQQIRDNETA